jgi:hypothetical protein
MLCLPARPGRDHLPALAVGLDHRRLDREGMGRDVDAERVFARQDLPQLRDEA